jgi:hypothetical protein
MRRKYHWLGSSRRKGQPGPKGPSPELIRAVVEMKRRNSRHGCPRIAQQITKAFGLSELIRYFRQAMQGIVHEAVVRRDEFEVRGRDLIEILRKPLELEAAEAFPLAGQVLSDEDWDLLDEQVSHTIDPVFGEGDPDRFRARYDYPLKQTRS